MNRTMKVENQVGIKEMKIGCFLKLAKKKTKL